MLSLPLPQNEASPLLEHNDAEQPASALVPPSPTRRILSDAMRRNAVTASISIFFSILVALSYIWLPRKTSFENAQSTTAAILSLPIPAHGTPCEEIMVGVWIKTCLVHVGEANSAVESQGMVSYIYVTLSDGSFAELQNDGNGFMSMYGTYSYTPGAGASRTQNCFVKYTSYYKQDPIDNWLPAPGSFTYNTWEVGKDFFTNLPNSLSCKFDRIKGADCRTLLSRLLSHLAGDGVSLMQYWNAPRDLC